MKWHPLMMSFGVIVYALQTIAAPGDLDRTFNVGSTTFGINQMVKQSDGKWIVIGGFTVIEGVEHDKIARLNSDWTVDEAFRVDTDALSTSFNGVCLLDSGKMYIYGVFSQVNGVHRSQIARLNPDGTLDSGFMDQMEGFNGMVSVVIPLPEGKILVGGSFNSVNGSSLWGCARLNQDGSLDSTFSVGLNSGVTAIGLQPDGKILLGGAFRRIQGLDRPGLVRIESNGAVDASFGGLGSEPNGTPAAIVPLADGNILVGGDFSLIGGANRWGVARLTSTGRADNFFGYNLSGAANGFQPGTVSIVRPQSDGTIIIAGGFAQVNGVARNGLARLTSSGQLDTSFAPDTNMWTGALSQTDDELIIAGVFQSTNGTTGFDLAQLNTDGSVKQRLLHGRGGFNRQVDAVTIQPASGKILVAGHFTQYDTTPQKLVARLNQDGSRDPSFQNPLTNWTGYATSIAATESRILVGGVFQTDGALPAGLVQLQEDGTFDRWLVRDMDYGGGVMSVALQNDRSILVGGNFKNFLGQSRHGIGRLTPEGAFDASFDAVDVPNGSSVICIKVQADGKIVIGGETPSSTGPTAALFMRLNPDGSTDTTFAAGLMGPNNWVTDIQLRNDRIFVSGAFTTFHGQSVSGVAKLTLDGTLDSSFAGLGSGRTALWTLPQSNGKIVCGRSFGSWSEITRLNADGSSDAAFRTSGAGIVHAIAESDYQLLVVGDFVSLQGVGCDHVARLWLTDPPRLSSQISDGTVRFNSAANPGSTFVIESAVDISGPWSEFMRTVTPDGAITLDLSKETISNGAAFFRLALP